VDLKIGAAVVDYTPEPGLPLMGNYRDDYGARGTHDPLNARALVFEDGAGARTALLVVDICMLDRGNVAFMRGAIEARCRLRGKDVLICATHTHSGPAPMRLGSLPKAEDPAIERFLTRAAGAVAEAERNLRPAAIGIGAASESRISFNRRLRSKDGTTHMNWERPDPKTVAGPFSSIDPEVKVLSVEQNGRTAAVAVNFGLHPAILAGDNWLYSADFPGYCSEALGRALGDDVVPIFLNGCCGNVNHLDYTDPLQGRGFKETQRVGYMLAAAAQRALRSGKPAADGPVAVSRETVELKRLPISEADYAWCRKVLARSGSAPGQVDGLPDEYYAVTRARMYEKQHEPDPVEVMVLRVGPVGIVGLPGEIFYEHGLAIKGGSPAPHTLVVELANDAIGYVPTKEAFAQGGYEPGAGAAFHTEDAGERLVASALRQLAVLFPQGG
jgi:neutral ceramidase